MSFTVFRPTNARDGYSRVAADTERYSEDDERNDEMIGLVNSEYRTGTSQRSGRTASDSASINEDLEVTDGKRTRHTESSEERKTVENIIDTIGFGKFQLRLLTLVGFAMIADSMEILTLTILAPALHCDMHLRAFHQALLTSVVFGGMLVGASAFGGFCDRYGRKACLILYPIITGYFGLLCTFAPRFEWILILRCLVGFGVGGAAQITTYLSEFLPTRWRAKGLVVISIFWAIGSVCESLLALFVMPTLGWRYLLLFSSLPILCFTFVAITLPESPRFLLISGREVEAKRVLEQVARVNGVNCTIPGLMINTDSSDSAHGGSLPPNDDDQLLLSDGERSEGSQNLEDMTNKHSKVRLGRVSDMLVPSLRRTTLTLWPIWLNTAFAYYGIVLLTTEIFEMDNSCLQGSNATSATNKDTYSDDCYVVCKMLDSSDYISIMLTSLAEFFSIAVTLFFIDLLGRRLTLAVMYLVYGVATLLLNLCLTRTVVTIVLFVSRAFISSAFQAIYVYTPEVYPTTVRAVGLGMCSSLARIGAIVTPMIAQILTKTSLTTTFYLYGGAGLLNFALSLSLPIETRGRTTHDTVK